MICDLSESLHAIISKELQYPFVRCLLVNLSHLQILTLHGLRQDKENTVVDTWKVDFYYL